MTLNISSNVVKNRLFGLFAIGVILLFIAIKLLTTISTSKNSLTPISGTLENCDIYITTVSSKNRYNYEAISQKSELIFYFTEFKKKFSISENIGSDYQNKDYNNIKAKLKSADSVTVWIKASELETWEPKIFQINADKETVLEFESVRFKESPLAIFLLILGLGCVLLPTYAFYPNLFKSK